MTDRQAERERYRSRETDRQTDRQAHRQTDRQTDADGSDHDTTIESHLYLSLFEINCHFRESITHWHHRKLHLKLRLPSFQPAGSEI